MRKRLLLSSITLASGLCATGASQAALTFYGSQASFVGATTADVTDTLDDIANRFPASGLMRGGFYAYTVTEASYYPFLGTGIAGTNHWLAAGDLRDTITLGGFSNGPQAIGANFFGSLYVNNQYPDKIADAANLLLTATDSLGATLTQTLTGATPTTFAGFVSTGTIISLKLSSASPSPSSWASFDNLTFGAAVQAVPEPGEWALLAGGLGAVGLATRRRQNRQRP